MKRLVIPAILAAVVLVAGIFAYAPVEKVSTVHTTINNDIGDQERVVTWNLDSVGGFNDYILIPDSDVTLVGNVTAVVLDGPATAGTESTVECVNDGGTVTALTAVNELDAAGETTSNDALSAGCEEIRVDVADGTHLLVTVHIDTFPEV